MHYFKRNIGDYHKKAGRLSMLEHGAYTLLIDSCYDRERFPTRDDAIEWTWARSDAEIAAVDFVLTKFFDLEDGIYVQNRIKEEIEKYHSNSKTNKRIAQEREEKRRTKRERSVNEPTPNHKPRTINQEPLTKNQEPISNNQGKSKAIAPAALLAALGIDPKISADWITLRKQKKAAITETALAGIQREAEKAGYSLETALRICCERGWAGFKAEWMQNGNGSGKRSPNAGRDLDAEMREFCGEGNVIEGESRNVG